MAATEVTVGGGIPVRLFRLSFSGELAYEMARPASYGDAAMRALMRAGAPHGITPYSTEALSVMRIEKGHVAGNEIDGRTTAADLGLGRMMSMQKDYLGRLMKERPGLIDPDRPVLAGFRPVDRSAHLRAGAHFLALGASPSLAADEGHMSSVAYSPSLGHWIGLGLIRRGSQRHGERVRAYDPVRGEDIEVEIGTPCHLDLNGEKLRG